MSNEQDRQMHIKQSKWAESEATTKKKQNLVRQIGGNAKKHSGKKSKENWI